MAPTLWANEPLPAGRTFSPDQGHVRLDKLEVYRRLHQADVRYEFGLVDEVFEVEGAPVRHCNWLRFLQEAPHPSCANVECIRVKGEPTIRVIKAISPNMELRAMFRREARENVLCAAEAKSQHFKETADNSLPMTEALQIKVSGLAPLDLRVGASDGSDMEAARSPLSSISSVSPRSLPSPPVPDRSSAANLGPFTAEISMGTRNQSERIPSVPSPKLDVTSSPPPSPIPSPSINKGTTDGHSGAPKDLVLPTRGLNSFTPFLPRMLPPGLDGSLLGHQGMLPVQANRSPSLPMLPPAYPGSILQLLNGINSQSSQGSPSVGSQGSLVSEREDDAQSTASEGSVGSDDSHASNEDAGKPDSKVASSPVQPPIQVQPGWTQPTAKSSPPAPAELPSNQQQQHPEVLPPPKRQRERTWLPCEVCGKKFDRPSLLKRHMRTHTGEKPHACDVCGKAFSTSSSLNTHRRIHSGEKPHQCLVCGKRFTASSNLYYHRMTHKKEKPHKCEMCSKSFPTPGDLKSHMYVHNGSWPYRCQVCNRGFSKQTNLRNHMMLHTGEKPYTCAVCNKKFALQCNLRTHMKTHQDVAMEECKRCGRSFPASQRQLAGDTCRQCLQPEVEAPAAVRRVPAKEAPQEPLYATPSTLAAKPGRALFTPPHYVTPATAKLPYSPLLTPAALPAALPAPNWAHMFDMYRAGLMAGFTGGAAHPK